MQQYIQCINKIPETFIVFKAKTMNYIGAHTGGLYREVVSVYVRTETDMNITS